MSARNQRIEVVVERIAERWREHHRPDGSGLMMVVHDLREPLEIELVVDVGGFLHIGHVKVAIIVVADVLLPQARDVL